MKKSFIFVASVLAIALASCTEVLPEKEASDSGMNKIVFGIASEAITKTALLDGSGKPDPDGVSPYWQKGDQILLEGDESFPQEIHTLGSIGDSMHNEKEYECATYFNGDSPFYGVYPSSSFVSRSGSSIKMKIPDKQSGNFKDAHFCAAQSYDNYSHQDYVRTYHLDFYPVAPILHFKKSDFQGYPGGHSLSVTGDLKGIRFHDVDEVGNGTELETSKNIVGDFEVTFDVASGKFTSKLIENENSAKEVKVYIDGDLPEDIYIAVWPGTKTEDIAFKYDYGVGSTTYVYSFPIRCDSEGQPIILECNKIYPAFFGRRVSTIETLNEILTNGSTTSNAHYLITRPSGGNIVFGHDNQNNTIGLDFSSDIVSGQTINFTVQQGDNIFIGPSALIIAAPKDKELLFTFDQTLMNTTKITVNGVPVKDASIIVE